MKIRTHVRAGISSRCGGRCGGAVLATRCGGGSRCGGTTVYEY